MRLPIAAVLACSLALGFAQAASATGSGTAVAYQVDAAHDGVQADDSLTPPFTRLWHVSLPGAVSYPLIAGGYVYVTVASTSGYGTTLYALRQSDGSTAWSTPISGTYFWSNAAYDAGRVFVVNFDGLLRAFAADTGAPAWSTQLPGQYAFSAAPTASNGVVYVGGAGSGGTLYSVDESNGAVLATQPVMNGDESSPALSSGSVFVSYACNQAYGFTTPSLTPLWHYSTFCEGGGGKTVVYAGGRVYTRDYYGNLVLDATSGNLIRTYAPQGTSMPAPAVDASTIFSLNGGTLTAQAASDGSVAWSFAGDGQLDTAPLVLSTSSGEFVVEGSGSGALYALNASTGAVAWQTNVGVAIPAPDEQNVSQPLTGLGAGQGLLVVPSGTTLSAYSHGVPDTTAPTINVPGTITAKGTSSSGAVVTYTVTAIDPDDAATVSCSPASGSLFPIGTTTVVCNASDTHGNTSSASFLVAVSDPGADCNLAHYPLVKGALNLKNANLSGCYLPGAGMASANATGANFVATYLKGANLSSANLSQARLQRAVLTNANLSGAKLNFANLTGATTTGANFTGVSWVQTTCPDGTNSSSNGGTCIGHL